MDLIKKIRAAEAQAQQIIEEAKTASARQAEQGRNERLQVMEQAERQRRKTVEDAVAVAKAQALAEAEKLKTQAEKSRRRLHDKVNARIDKVTAKVMDYLKG